MQTFLPYADFAASAKCLDYRRLGKQRIECLQILTAIASPEWICKVCKKCCVEHGNKVVCSEHPDPKNVVHPGWKYHSATKMWIGYEQALIRYGVAMCDEWIQRGYSDTTKDKILSFSAKFSSSTADNPPWLGDKKFHDSHKSNLLRKDKLYYSTWKWDVQDDLEYVWPSKA